jgi:hypothetical protein
VCLLGYWRLFRIVLSAESELARGTCSWNSTVRKGDGGRDVKPVSGPRCSPRVFPLVEGKPEALGEPRGFSWTSEDFRDRLELKGLCQILGRNLPRCCRRLCQYVQAALYSLYFTHLIESQCMSECPYSSI